MRLHLKSLIAVSVPPEENSLIYQYLVAMQQSLAAPHYMHHIPL
jgi:hypothetical protein